MKKSKVDAIIKRKIAEAEERGRREGRCSGIREGRQIERDENTFLLTVQDGAALLGEVPKHPYLRVPLPEQRRVRDFRGLTPDDERSLMLRTAGFRARQMCWTTAEGHKAVWFDWQFEGVS